MYCPYCRSEVYPVVKTIAEREETQTLPACCFERVELEERNAHVLTREEMLDLLGNKMPESQDFLARLKDRDLYELCVGFRYVSYPPVESSARHISETWHSCIP